MNFENTPKIKNSDNNKDINKNKDIDKNKNFINIINTNNFFNYQNFYPSFPFMNNNYLYFNPINMNPSRLINEKRLRKEYELCRKCSNLVQIGCSFGLVENNNFYIWEIIMIGPKKTPYEYGVFTILVIFPSDYLRYGAKFIFINNVYHLNVYQDIHKNIFGRIDLYRLNEWRDTGRVTSFPLYNKAGTFRYFLFIL